MNNRPETPDIDIDQLLGEIDTYQIDDNKNEPKLKEILSEFGIQDPDAAPKQNGNPVNKGLSPNTQPISTEDYENPAVIERIINVNILNKN